MLGYGGSSRPVWVMRDPVSRNNKKSPRCSKPLTAWSGTAHVLQETVPGRAETHPTVKGSVGTELCSSEAASSPAPWAFRSLSGVGFYQKPVTFHIHLQPVNKEIFIGNCKPSLPPDYPAEVGSCL